MISAIVPTCNEEELLPRCLESILNEREDLQLIVVDGGSTDRTLQVARSYTDQVLVLEKADLAAQLNAGAAKAAGDIILFLHADSRLTPGTLGQLKQIPFDTVGGAFSMQLDGSRYFYRLLSLGGNLYCRLTGTYFGDRGIFARPSTFNKLKGFKTLPIMSDVDFSKRMQKLGRCVLLKGPVISSSRKFDREGPLHTLYLIIYALIAFRFGVSAEVIKEKYYKSPLRRSPE